MTVTDLAALLMVEASFGCAELVFGRHSEVGIDSQELQLPNGLQQRDGVAGKPGNGLGNDQVDLSSSAIVKKSLEVLTGILGSC